MYVISGWCHTSLKDLGFFFWLFTFHHQWTYLCSQHLTVSIKDRCLSPDWLLFSLPSLLSISPTSLRFIFLGCKFMLSSSCFLSSLHFVVLLAPVSGGIKRVLGHGGNLPPLVRGSAPLPVRREKIAKISHFWQILGFLPLPKHILLPQCLPSKKFWCYHWPQSQSCMCLTLRVCAPGTS